MNRHAETKPWLILPMETKAREFHAKTLLAATAAARGYDVLLGEQNALLAQLPHLPRGLYLDKSVARTKLAHFRKLHELGFKIGAWCEEGLVYRDRDAYLRERVHVENLEMTERFFAWGPVQAADMAIKSGDAAQRIVQTGNARGDMLRPELRGLYEAETAACRSTHGPYLLINTNFSRYNHYLGYDSWIEGLKQRGTLTTVEQEQFYFAWRDFLGEIHHGFMDVLPALSAAFPDYRIIVRPHPSEDARPWQEAAQPLSNVSVIGEGPVVPWLLGAEAVIHNSCTTGLEAHLLGKPVLAYRPSTSETYDSPLPNAVSRNAYDRTELIAATEACLAGDEGQTKPSAARDYLSALDGPLAVERIVDAIDDIGLQAHTLAGGGTSALARMGSRWATALRPAARRVLRGAKASGYVKQKFPGIDIAEVRTVLTDLQKALSRFEDVRAEPLPVHHGFKITSR